MDDMHGMEGVGKGADDMQTGRSGLGGGLECLDPYQVRRGDRTMSK